MQASDSAILEIVGRYRVVVPSALNIIPEGDGPPQTALSRLCREGLVTRSGALPGNRRVFQLTKKGASHVGLSEARARYFQAQALFKHLGIFLFCHVPGSRRFRIEETELHTLLGDTIPEGTHVMTIVDERPILLNAYVPGPRTSLRSIQRRIRRQLDSVSALPAVRTMLEERTYGLAILTETAERRRAILAMLRRPERDGAAPLAKQIRIHVEALPEFDRLLNGVSTNVSDAAPIGSSCTSTSSRGRQPGRRGTRAASAKIAPMPSRNPEPVLQSNEEQDTNSLFEAEQEKEET